MFVSNKWKEISGSVMDNWTVLLKIHFVNVIKRKINKAGTDSISINVQW